METGNCVTRLQEYAQKTRSELQYEDLGFVGPDHDPTFIQRVVLNGKVYPEGAGKNKKEAKRDAAKNALKCLFENEPQDSADTSADDNNSASGEPKEELNVDVSDIRYKIRSLKVNAQLHRDKRETNYIGIVANYCLKTNRCHSYIEERRCGPAHGPQFFYKLMIDKKEYPEGEGRTVKEAKQNAARLAWSALQEQSDWDSKVSVRSTVSEDGAQSMLSVPSATPESHESSTQSTSMITFTDSSTPSQAQMPSRSTMSEDDAPTGLSTPTSLFTSYFDPMECLGRGAFGCVYKARDKQLDKFYAVKIVYCEEKSLREVGTLSDLLHRNIVRYYTFWMEDSGYQWDILADSNSSSQPRDNSSAKYIYIQMELCDTKTLKVWIEEKNAQPLQDSKRREESLRIAQQIVGGVEYLHSEKHIHRDLKPENILFGLNGEVKIGDFGLVTRDADDDSALMERTENKGTTTYMAPEQKTERNYDRKVDIFALGLIYFELLWKLSTGHERGKIWDDARSQKLPEEFSLTFREEDQIIKSMLCGRPEDRPEASQLKAKLEQLTQTLNAQNMSRENATA
ncbi:interferon-induced, double-stranded RNA-activated protein kinase-like isoform X2 [Epinephelus lanceolatus]